MIKYKNSRFLLLINYRHFLRAYFFYSQKERFYRCVASLKTNLPKSGLPFYSLNPTLQKAFASHVEHYLNGKICRYLPLMDTSFYHYMISVSTLFIYIEKIRQCLFPVWILKKWCIEYPVLFDLNPILRHNKGGTLASYSLWGYYA